METLLTFKCGHAVSAPISYTRFAHEVDCINCKQARLARTEQDAMGEIFATDSSDDSRQPAPLTAEQTARIESDRAFLQAKAAADRSYGEFEW